MSFRSLLARQLGRPSGLAGLFMARTLNRVNARVNAMALDRLALDASDHVLDVGFGGGLVLQAAEAAGARAAGIEISQPMIKRAQRRFRAGLAAGRIDVREASVAAIPFDDRTFSKVVTINTMHFWPDALTGCREIARVLKPGGLFVLGVRPKDYLQRINFTEHGFTAFDDDEVRAILSAAQFVKIGIEHHDDADMGIVLVTAVAP